MEDLLLSIVKEAGGTKSYNIKQSAQEAYGKYHNKTKKLNNIFVIRKQRTCSKITLNVLDLLCSQNNLLRTPSHELRTSCFLPLRLSLESKRSKLVSLSLTGLNVSVLAETALNFLRNSF